jgi:hypothetical protein
MGRREPEFRISTLATNECFSEYRIFGIITEMGTARESWEFIDDIELITKSLRVRVGQGVPNFSGY